MKYNDLLNELLDLLDQNKDIMKVKELKKNLLNNQELRKDLDIYREKNSVEAKLKLFKNLDYLKYLDSKNNVNYLIQDIKSKFNIFISRKCQDESN